MLLGTSRPYIFLLSILFILSLLDYKGMVLFFSKASIITSIQQKINLIPDKKYVSPLLLDVIFIIMTVTNLALYASGFSFTNSYLAKNRITYADRVFAQSIDFMDYSKSYLIDSPINEYLAGGVNISEFLLYYLQGGTV